MHNGVRLICNDNCDGADSDSNMHHDAPDAESITRGQCASRMDLDGLTNTLRDFQAC